MKTKSIRKAFLLAALLILGHANAKGPGTGGRIAPEPGRSAMQRALDRQLNRHIIYPMMGTADMTGEVTVSLAVNAQGRIEVLEATGTNEALKAYVLRRLALVHIGTVPEGGWHPARIRFNFRPGA